MNPTWISIFALSICFKANAYSFSNIHLFLPRAFPPLLGPDLGDGYNEPAIPSPSLTTKPNLLEPTPTHLLHSSSSTAGSETFRTSSSILPLGIFQTHSIIGSPKPLPTSSYTPSAILPSTTYSYIPVTPTVSSVNESSVMSPGEASQWKVIGIGVITIVVIIALVLSVVFFNSWTRFLFGRKKQSEGTEDMVPDWEKRSWEYKLASEGGHRYPTHETTTPAQTHAQLQEQPTSVAPSCRPYSFAYDPAFHNQWPTATTPIPPPTVYQPDVDPHPLDPLFRRPSIRATHVKSPSLLPY